MKHTEIRPILLIEDNPMDIDLTRRAFKKHHLANPIDLARDGEEALSFIERWDAGELIPAVILLDLNLPKYSGLEVLRQLKEHEKYRIIPVVVLSTSAENRDIKTAYEYGVNSYIVKPVDFDKFISVAAQIEVYWLTTNVSP